MFEIFFPSCLNKHCLRTKKHGMLDNYMDSWNENKKREKEEKKEKKKPKEENEN